MLKERKKRKAGLSISSDFKPKMPLAFLSLTLWWSLGIGIRKSGISISDSMGIDVRRLAKQTLEAGSSSAFHASTYSWKSARTTKNFVMRSKLSTYKMKCQFDVTVTSEPSSPKPCPFQSTGRGARRPGAAHSPTLRLSHWIFLFCKDLFLFI